MFDSANLEHVLDDATYEREAKKIRVDLLNAQYDLKQCARFPVLVLVGGIDGAGKSETVNLLNEWMDPRHVLTRAFTDPTSEEQERPIMYRYWRALPPKGTVGIFFGAWDQEPIFERAMGRIGRAEFDQRIAEVLRFERMLSDEGTLILKFWFHLTKEQQKKRL